MKEFLKHNLKIVYDLYDEKYNTNNDGYDIKYINKISKKVYKCINCNVVLYFIDEECHEVTNYEIDGMVAYLNNLFHLNCDEYIIKNIIE
jgi:hypothetical protein